MFDVITNFPLPVKERSYEFHKLEHIDLKAAFWIAFKCPRILYPYLEFTVKNDYEQKGIKLNARKIYNELIEVRNS